MVTKPTYKQSQQTINIKQHPTNNQRQVLVMETDLPKRVFASIKTKVVIVIYGKINGKYFSKKTIIVGEH